MTFGDSVPVVGDAPMFPDRLATLIGDLAEVDSRNIAVGGTLSTDWVPGSNYFENRLRPNIADADVIVISVGGNDITSSLDASALQDIDKAIEILRKKGQKIAEKRAELAQYDKSLSMVQYGKGEPSVPGYYSVRGEVEKAYAAIINGDDIMSTLNQLNDDANAILADATAE